jgi:DNA-binding MarR family transcriptional regulator
LSTILFFNQLSKHDQIEIPVGTRTLILSKLYYGILSKKLEGLEIDRYFSILFFIQNNNGCCCQQDICDNLFVDKTAMVKVLDTLDSAGLIERKVNPKDRRQHYVSLSRKGEKYAKEIGKTFASVDKRMFDNISERDRKTFDKVLNKLTANLQDVPKNQLLFNYKMTK